MQLLPTDQALKAMAENGLQWGDVLALMDRVQNEQPVPNQPRARAHFADCYVIYTRSTWFDGEKALEITGIGNRNRDDQVITTPVPERRTKGHKKGGQGQLLPTSFDEILKRIDDTDGWDYVLGGKHVKILGPEGQTATVPVTTSDFRAVRNAASVLRRLGLDVRRKVS